MKTEQYTRILSFTANKNKDAVIISGSGEKVEVEVSFSSIINLIEQLTYEERYTLFAHMKSAD